MNVEELSMIGPTVDLETVDPIHKKRLLAFVNHFVVSTASFLNTVSKSCEERFMALESKMQKLEASIVVLESKLSSVSGLDSGEDTEVASEVTEAATVVAESAAGDETIAQEPEPETAPEQAPLAPELAKYVKMLQVGVPAQAVRLKLVQDGVDPNLHDDIIGRVAKD